MRHSLRRHLALAFAGFTLVAWLTGAIVAYWNARTQMNALLDAHLAHLARAMLALSLHEVHEERLFAELDGHSKFGEAVARGEWDMERAPEDDLAFQIWIEHDRLALRSHNAPALPLSRRNRGFSDVLIDGEPWRVYSLQTEDGDIRVQLGERRSKRTAMADRLTVHLLLPLAIALPLLFLFVHWNTGRALSPFQRLAQALTHRGVDTLRPLQPEAFPVEARPLANAVNRLIQRVEEALDNERRFTSDAAHELRTPLAALKTQAQVALRTEDPEQREQALRQVMKGVDRAAHLVDQLLTLARLDPGRNRIDTRLFDLYILAEDVLSGLAPEALDKDIELALTGRRGQFVHSHREGLAVLLHNLVQNAIRYTPPGGQVQVDVHTHDGTTELVVSDSGPGIPERERERVFQRFYRGPGTRAPGSGLGLSIVHRIATLNGLEIHLGESSLGGLRVTVTLPDTQSPPQSG